MPRFTSARITESFDAVAVENARHRTRRATSATFASARRAALRFAALLLTTALPIACSAQSATPDDPHASSGADETESTSGTGADGAESSERTAALTVDEDRFLRRIVPDYDQLAIAGDPRQTLDAWADGEHILQVWFPAGDDCLEVSLERDNDGWNGALPICLDFTESDNVEAHCSFSIDDYFLGSMVGYSIRSAGGTESFGVISHGCDIPSLSATHGGDEQLTFGGTCATANVLCSEHNTTQTCLDGSQRTCSRCADLETAIGRCTFYGSGSLGVGTLNVAPNGSVDCSEPCEPAVTPEQADRANGILGRVDWMQPTDTQFNIYRTAESCALDDMSMNIAQQQHACGLIADQLSP